MSRFKMRRFEVFVVGGLILGLWFVLYFSFERARKIKRGELCQSNLKMIALASKQYERDYDEHFPLSKNWTMGLFPYHKNSAGFHCPSLPKNGYAVNKHLNALTHTHISDQNSQQIPQYFETQKLEENASGGSEIWLAMPRHPQGVVIAFMDGHCEWLIRKPLFRSFAPAPKLKPQNKLRNKNSRRNE